VVDDLATLWQSEHERATVSLDEWPSRVNLSTVVARVRQSGKPHAWQRPIYVEQLGRQVTPSETIQAEQALAAHFLDSLGETGAPRGDKGHVFGVRLRFVLPDRRRIDVDNLVKTVLDAGRHIVWEDDCQVVELHALKVVGEVARTEILIYRVGLAR